MQTVVTCQARSVVNRREGTNPPLVSVELVSQGESSTLDVLESIAAQTLKDVEVILADSSESPEFSSQLSSRVTTRVRLPPSARLFRAREYCHRPAKGSFCLLLDATRSLKPTCLETLVRHHTTSDMVTVREESISQSRWAELARIDKQVTFGPAERGRDVALLGGTILPRFFRKDVLDSAFSCLASIVPTDVLDRVLYGDHHLIFAAASRCGFKSAVEPTPLVLHVEDQTIAQTIRKYARYGRSFPVIREIPVLDEVGRLRPHQRSFTTEDARLRWQILPLQAVRALSFLTGYFWGAVG